MHNLGFVGWWRQASCHALGHMICARILSTQFPAASSASQKLASNRRKSSSTQQVHNRSDQIRKKTHEQKFASMAVPAYIISRVADPIFAVLIGVSAAVTRINREEKSKGRTTNEILEVGLRYG